ncbi:MAG: hypothetical protein Q8L10_05470 [Candidatus Moranbacteria bacterium]|nr:hypothetical protein [Candidatus Moranbacteria bacterium]
MPDKKENLPSVENEPMESAMEKKSVFSGIPSIEELRGVPVFHEAAKKIIQELSNFKCSLIEYLESSDHIKILSNEVATAYASACEDAENDKELRELKDGLSQVVTELANITNIINSKNPAQGAYARGYIKDYQASSFSFKSRIKAMFKSEDVLEKRNVENEAAILILRDEARNIIYRANEQPDAVKNKAASDVNILKTIELIAQSTDAQEVDKYRKLMQDYAHAAAYISSVSQITTDFNKQINKKTLDISYGLSTYWNVLFPNAINEYLQKKRIEHAREIIPQKVEALKKYLDSDDAGMPYSITNEGANLIEQCNVLCQSILGPSFWNKITAYNSGEESRKISAGRILTHAAVEERMYEVLADGELMSMEAQARKKGKARRSHGINLVKEDYMDDRNSMESHSVTFEVDGIYRTFLKTQGHPVIILALPENYLLSSGYLFDESDGEHLFDPDFTGKNKDDGDRPATINLKEVPIIFMVESEKYDEFCSFLLAKSAWKDELAAMDESERIVWISERVAKRSPGDNSIPLAVKSKLAEMAGSSKKGFVYKTKIQGNLKKQDGDTLKAFVLQKRRDFARRGIPNGCQYQSVRKK